MEDWTLRWPLQPLRLSTNRPKYRKVALGGTFDIIHSGHVALFSHAFQVGQTVLVGVVGDEMAARIPKNHPVLAFSERVRNLNKFLDKNGWTERAIVKQLDDKYGSTVSDPSIEAIVVTSETAGTADEINRIRSDQGLKPLKVETVAFVLAEDGGPISTTRVRKGEIDSRGKLLHRRSGGETRIIG